MKILTLQESFQSGMAERIMIKLMKVLGRRLHRKLNPSATPYFYKSEYGKFAGYFVSIDNSKKLFRVNFMLTEKSDVIYSVDFYSSMLRAMVIGKPSFTIDTEGLNVIEVLDVISENILAFDASLDDEDSLAESSKKTEKKDEYDIFHKSYTSAVDEIIKYCKKSNYYLDEDDIFTYISTMGRPHEGETKRGNLPLYNGDGTPAMKGITFQVYAMKVSYELNMYFVTYKKKDYDFDKKVQVHGFG